MEGGWAGPCFREICLHKGRKIVYTEKERSKETSTRAERKGDGCTMMIALTGAGISAASGIPTFQAQPGVRRKLTRSFAKRRPAEHREVIRQMTEACRQAAPNDAHYALAEYHIPVITMNVDGLHQKAGSAFVLPIHGNLPDIVLYEEPLDQNIMAEAIHYIRHAEVLIVGGTSLNVYPAAGLINYYRGNKLVLVNRSATPYDSYADLVIHANIGDVFSQV